MTRGEAFCAASVYCASCHGSGEVGRVHRRVCGCVHRRLFRDCLQAYRDLADPVLGISPYGLEVDSRPVAAWRKIRPEDYRADFQLLARRALDPALWPFFKSYFLEQTPLRSVMRRFRLNRGNFWHAAYRCQTQLGQAIERSRPYSLWPVSDYLEQGWRPAVLSPARLLPLAA